MPPKRTARKKVEVNVEEATSSENVVEEQTTKGRKKAKKNSAVAGSVENDSHASSEVEIPTAAKTRGRPTRKPKDAAQNGKETSPEKVQGSRASTRKTKASKTEDVQEPPKKKAKTKVQESSDDGENAKTIYEFKVNDINGKEVSLQKYKGHVCIIVNVASRCGHTKSNYEQLVQIYDKYSKDKGLRVLAFPCNQFGKQEPGDSQKICEFVKKKNVKFDMFEKLEVNGKNAHPLWKFLNNEIAGPKGNVIDWNFTKFIIDKEGNVVERHKPGVKPLQMVEMLEKYW